MQLLEPVGGAACLQHPSDGGHEPLVSMWTPPALATLQSAVAAGKTGPCRTLKAIGARLVPPLHPKAAGRWLFNVNTPAELAQAEAML